MQFNNTNYFFDVIGFIIPILALIYWTRKEPDGIWIFLKDIHENNLKDYDAYFVAIGENRIRSNIIEWLKKKKNEYC